MPRLPLTISAFCFSLLSSLACAEQTTSSLPADNLEAAKVETMKLEVIDPYVDMHTGPGRGYPVFHVIEQGETIEVLKRRPDWYEIRSSNGKTGWSKASQISRTLQPTGVPVDLPSVGHGDYLKNGWRVGFTGGQIAQGDIKGADTFSVNAGYRPLSWLGTELEGGKVYSNKVSGDYYGGNVLVEPFPLWNALLDPLTRWDIKAKALPNWKLTPYLLFGVGKMALDAQPQHTELGFDRSSYYNYALGANYYLARNFVIRGEYRWYSVSANDDTVKLEEWKFGFSTFF